MKTPSDYKIITEQEQKIPGLSSIIIIPILYQSNNSIIKKVLKH